MEKKKRSTAKALSVFAIISAVIAYIYFFTEYIRSGLTGETNEGSIIPFLLVIFYFFPLVLLIDKFAKLEKKDKILQVTRILVPFLGLFTVVAAIVMLVLLLA